MARTTRAATVGPTAQTRDPATSYPLHGHDWLDLVLTKMMRGDDPQDMADIAFLIRHDRLTAAQIESALADVVIPDLVEFRDAFERAKPRVLEMAAKAGG